MVIPAPTDIMSVDDVETHAAVVSVQNVERIVSICLFLYYAIGVVVSFYKSFWLGVADLLFGAFIVFVVIAKVVNWIVVNPIRASKFGPCIDRMRTNAAHLMSVAKSNSWKTPLPRYLAIDPAGGTLFVEGPDTSYRGLVLRRDQILHTKVEREQTVETTTKHSGRAVYGSSFSSFGVGRIGGGRSTSVSKTTETAFLEISYVPDPGSVPARVVFPFGVDRRGADDWMMAISHMCRA
jgi:hypothetical protein